MIKITMQYGIIAVLPTSTVKLIRLPINYMTSILIRKAQNVEDNFDSSFCSLYAFHTVLKILSSS